MCEAIPSDFGTLTELERLRARCAALEAAARETLRALDATPIKPSPNFGELLPLADARKALAALLPAAPDPALVRELAAWEAASDADSAADEVRWDSGGPVRPGNAVADEPAAAPTTPAPAATCDGDRHAGPLVDTKRDDVKWCEACGRTVRVPREATHG